MEESDIDLSRHHVSSSPATEGNTHEPRRKRRRRDDERVRVSRACDRCKKKKQKCTGLQPCEICVRAVATCTYEAPYSRGSLPSVMIAPDHGIPNPEASRITPGTSQSTTEGGALRSSTLAAQSDPNLTTSSLRNSPEPSQTDSQGHYVGPASGVSFLLRVQKKLHQTLSFSQTSSIFTFGDAPLPDFDASFFILPPRDEANHLLERYFDFAVPTHRFLHRPTIEAWMAEMYDTMGAMRGKEDARARTALLFMVFAQAREYTPPPSGREKTDTGARYFLAAEHQLSKERGEVKLTSVQARLCQCFYLLSLSRINHCWSLFGTTAHLALAIGLNRSRKTDLGLRPNHIEVECRRRVFWCAYTLDNYLSAALGRPRTFHDEDIDQELPSIAQDSDIYATHILPPKDTSAQSIMLAPVAHVKLSLIVGKILRDLYPIRPVSLSSRLQRTTIHSTSLQTWYFEIESFLDDSKIKASLLLPIFQRQRNVLNLAYWQAIILTHRPLLLSNFARTNVSSVSVGRTIGRQTQTQRHNEVLGDSIEKCLEAALNIVNLVDYLVHTKAMYRSFWFTSYYAFCASVILYIYTIQERSSPYASSSHSSETYSKYLKAASKCKDQLSSIADKESLAHRYCLLLEELRIEARKCKSNTDTTERDINGLDATEHHDNGLSHFRPGKQEQDLSLEAGSMSTSTIGQGHNVTAVAPPSQFQSHLESNLQPSPGNLSLDFNGGVAGWGTFDSMVTSGFGNMEALLSLNNNDSEDGLWDYSAHQEGF